MTLRRRALRTVRPSVEGASFVRLAADGRRLAFVRGLAPAPGSDRGAEAGAPPVRQEVRQEVCVADGADAEPVSWVELAPGWKVRHLSWTPSARAPGEEPLPAELALVVSRSRQARHELRVAWLAGPLRSTPAAVEPDLEDVTEDDDGPALGLSHVAGHAFAWAAAGRTLLVADVAARKLVAVPLRSKRRIELAGLPDDGHPGWPPHILPAPGGERVAFTCRRLDDAASELWVYTHGRGAEIVTAVPGSQLCAYALWSPKGRTLALYVVHREQDTTGLIAVPELAGEGLVLFSSKRAEPACAPVWAPSGRDVVLWACGRRPVATLCGLDLVSQVLVPLNEPGELSGSPRFVAPDTLLVDGADAAHLLTLEA